MKETASSRAVAFSHIPVVVHHIRLQASTTSGRNSDPPSESWGRRSSEPLIDGGPPTPGSSRPEAETVEEGSWIASTRESGTRW